jgi:hypothetical protein
LIESLDLRPSNQYIFLSESPSCLRLEEICMCQVRRKDPICSETGKFPCEAQTIIWTEGHAVCLNSKVVRVNLTVA